MDSQTVLSNAKINLFFAIHTIRPDGFCEVTSLITPVSLADTLTFHFYYPSHRPFYKVKFSSPLPFPSTQNTLTRAIYLFREATGIGNFSLEIALQKKIPIGGGFGGGSSNGVTVLKVLNQFFGEPLSRKQLVTLAQKLGTDCPFFIENTLQYATERGDLLSPVPEILAQQLRRYRCLLFCPHFSISTISAYTIFKRHPHFIPKFSPKNHLISRKNDLNYLESLPTKNFENLLFNSFEAQTLAQYPQLQRLFFALRKSGYSPHLTGSGSGCFCLVPEVTVQNFSNKNDTSYFDRARNLIRHYLGPNVFYQEVSFL